MNWDQLQLKPRIISAIHRAHLKSVREVLVLSEPDLQKMTGLSCPDVQELLHAAATACRARQPITALQLQRGECPRLESGLRLGTGCPVLDQLLRGGLPVGGVTELAGESGAGKTQLGLQLCLSVQYPVEHGGLNAGALYVCTEDPFPIRRLQQLISEQTSLRSDVPPSLIGRLRFSDNVYVEHAADLDSLQACLSRRAALLLAQGRVRLVVVDSVAALFRSEFQPDDWMERNKQLLTVSSMVHHLSHEFTTPVLCINQVTDVFHQSESSSSESRPRSGLGQSGYGSADAAPSPGDCFQWRPEQRPAQVGGGVRSSPGPVQPGPRRVEGGAPRGSGPGSGSIWT
ncbi:DNA repair protein XRCC3 isoform X2 [Poeciliopsis prolifica]|uniref:DNA repair protein XRCC3 isoform X2 n=1 Tax=Poeciliopsis prolifica TaxID=188132 RepID=UPI0024143BA5|nr:DNA repair protein XRCC3 isoform X2 [Poeciliopsis prolifica]